MRNSQQALIQICRFIVLCTVACCVSGPPAVANFREVLFEGILHTYLLHGAESLLRSKLVCS